MFVLWAYEAERDVTDSKLSQHKLILDVNIFPISITTKYM